MNKPRVPLNKAGDNELNTFIEKANKLPQRVHPAAKAAGRLIFALDATASRQPSWDRACQLQGNMFLAASSLGGLAVQLCYYRGFNEFYHSEWLQDSQRLLSSMNNVQCLGGYTQLAKTLDHCLFETRQSKVNAVVIIGDAVQATFGAPVSQPDHAARAVKCALEIDAFAEAYRAEWNRRGIALGATRIGVNSGEAIIGNAQWMEGED